MQQGNIYNQIPDDLSSEVFEILARGNDVKVERIISKGHTTPEADWYDQDHSEWVIILRGTAVISFERGSVVQLKEGDYVNIEAHEKHKVVSTSTNSETIWLAIHY